MSAGATRQTRGAGVPNASLVLDLLEWLADGRRPYTEVMSAWRTSCPRLSIWEDALAMGWVRCVRDPGAAKAWVLLTPEGRRALDAERPGS